jgi:alpha-N-arabinofuranosidase
MPAVSVSASRDKDGAVHISLVNAHASDSVDVSCQLEGIEATEIEGRILTSKELDAHNTFDQPESVKPGPFRRARFDDGTLTVPLPPRAVVVLTLT